MGDTVSIDEWYVVPQNKTRDANVLDESNFDCILKHLGGESDTVEVHRFGHWACGWYELILVHPSRKNEVEKIEKDLDNYPVFDEDHYSQACDEARDKFWAELSISDRVKMCQEAGISIFQARHDYCPCAGSGESLLDSIN
jgi:hypothetical protein